MDLHAGDLSGVCRENPHRGEGGRHPIPAWAVTRFAAAVPNATRDTYPGADTRGAQLGLGAATQREEVSFLMPFDRGNKKQFVFTGQGEQHNF